MATFMLRMVACVQDMVESAEIYGHGGSLKEMSTESLICHSSPKC